MCLLLKVSLNAVWTHVHEGWQSIPLDLLVMPENAILVETVTGHIVLKTLEEGKKFVNVFDTNGSFTSSHFPDNSHFHVCLGILRSLLFLMIPRAHFLPRILNPC